jgi:hypothetical protein
MHSNDFPAGSFKNELKNYLSYSHAFPMHKLMSQLSHIYAGLFLLDKKLNEKKRRWSEDKNLFLNTVPHKKIPMHIPRELKFSQFDDLQRVTSFEFDRL